MTHPPARRPAFSLIELLVVLSILGVLVALAAPALSRARGVAREAKCVANLRSLGQAHAAYTVDHKRRFPAGEDPRVGYVNLFGEAAAGVVTSANTPTAERLLNGHLGGNAGDAAVCPLDRGSTVYTQQRVADRFGSSYLHMNSQMNRFTRRVTRNNIWSLEGFGVHDVSSPATKMALADFIVIRSLRSGERHAWHGAQGDRLRAGMAFVDGSARVLGLKLDPATVFQSQPVRSFNQIEAFAARDPYY